MKKSILILLVASGVLAGFSASSSAQTNVYTVTNVVTILVTNVVTITNVVASAPAPAALPEARPATVQLTARFPWQSSVSAGLTLTRGNSHTLLYSGDFLTAKKTPANEYTLGADGAYGSQDSKDNVNNYHAFGQWNHLFTDRLYDYVRVDALRDVIADLDCRFNLGPGAGYYLIKQTNTTFAAEAGAGYQYEHLGGDFNSFATFRLAERFEHKFNDRARVWQNVEFLPQVNELENYVVNSEIGVETAITKSFSLKTFLDDSYQSQPAAGRQKNDVKIVSGISYKF
jgi:putative salt-induced outer membrane protein